MRLERLPLSSTQALSKSNPSDFRPTCAVVGENDAPAFVPVNDYRKTSQVAQCQKQLLFLRSGRPSVRPPPQPIDTPGASKKSPISGSNFVGIKSGTPLPPHSWRSLERVTYPPAPTPPLGQMCCPSSIQSAPDA